MKVSQRYYRPDFREIIIEYVRTCEKCQINKIGIATGASMKYLQPEEINQLVCTDYCGDFPTSSKGNKYIQIITEARGKYTIFVAHPNKQACGAAEALIESWCCIFGVPEAILSDGGKEFQSCLWDQLCEMYDLERLKITIHHPPGNGQSEREVQTLKSMIRSYVDEHQTNSDRFLPQLADCYNSSVHATTGCTPFETMFARQPRLPIDLIYPRPMEELTEGAVRVGQPLDQLVLDMKERLISIGKLLDRNKTVKMDKAKIRHDRRIKKEQYEVGDLVLSNHPKYAKGMARGLTAKYYGPFQVISTNENGCTYLIKRVGHARSRAKQVHKVNLKKWFHRGLFGDREMLVTQEPPPETQEPVNAFEDENEPVGQVRKRGYRKDPNCPRWKDIRAQQDNESESDARESSSSDESIECQLAAGAQEPIAEPLLLVNPESCQEVAVSPPQRKKRKYTKKPECTRWKKDTNAKEAYFGDIEMEERVEHDIEEEPEQRTEPQVTKRVYTRGENVTFKPQTTRYGRTSIPRISKTSSAL
jgi:hypothetical protein